MRDDYDFAGAQLGTVIKTTKERISIRLDPEVIQWFRGRVEVGGNDQTLINPALHEHIWRQTGIDLESTLRRVVREERRKAR